MTDGRDRRAGRPLARPDRGVRRHPARVHPVRSRGRGLVRGGRPSRTRRSTPPFAPPWPAPESIGLRLALKLAESRRVIASLDRPVTVTLLNPVYKETGRMQRRSEHPHGEDSLRTKVEALRRARGAQPRLPRSPGRDRRRVPRRLRASWPQRSSPSTGRPSSTGSCSWATRSIGPIPIFRRV